MFSDVVLTLHKIDDVGLNVLRCLADISGTKKIIKVQCCFTSQRP